MSESEPKAEMVLPADAVYLIFFDDRDCPPQIIVGGAAARHRFKEVSISWNAHLFGKIESNCRDDKYHANNIQLAASPQVPLTAQEWLKERPAFVPSSPLYADLNNPGRNPSTGEADAAIAVQAAQPKDAA